MTLLKVTIPKTKTLKELYHMLKDHDWTFQYSDDNKYYAAGQQERDAIKAAQRLSPDHHKLVQEYFLYRQGGPKPQEPE